MPLVEVVGSEGVGGVFVFFASWAGDSEVGYDSFEAVAAAGIEGGWKARGAFRPNVGGAGCRRGRGRWCDGVVHRVALWRDVLDDLGDFAGAAGALPDVFGFLLDAVEAEADADGVEGVGLEDTRDGIEVVEHGAVGVEVADGVDEVEGEGVAGPGAALGEGGVEVFHSSFEEAGAGAESRRRVIACVGDHGGFEVEAGDGLSAGSGEAGEAGCAAGGFEPWAGAGAEAEACVDALEEGDFFGGAGAMEDVVERRIFVERRGGI